VRKADAASIHGLSVTTVTPQSDRYNRYTLQPKTLESPDDLERAVLKKKPVAEERAAVSELFKLHERAAVKELSVSRD
jgi:hypothetical protein